MKKSKFNDWVKECHEEMRRNLVKRNEMYVLSNCPECDMEEFFYKPHIDKGLNISCEKCSLKRISTLKMPTATDRLKMELLAIDKRELAKKDWDNTPDELKEEILSHNGYLSKPLVLDDHIHKFILEQQHGRSFDKEFEDNIFSSDIEL